MNFRSDIPEIMKNIAFIREICVNYYKAHNIDYEDHNAENITPLNTFFPKIHKRKIEISQSVKKIKKL